MSAYTIMNLGLGNGWVLAKHRRHSDGVHGIVLTRNGHENAFGFKTIAELESYVRLVKEKSWQKTLKVDLGKFDHSVGHFVGEKQG